MFRDKDEELARLEEELLEKEEPEEEEELAPEDPDEESEAYVNYANNYKAYNADKADLDLEEFSEEVYTPTPHRHMGLLTAIMLLLAGILLVLGWWLVRYMGVIG